MKYIKIFRYLFVLVILILLSCSPKVVSGELFLFSEIVNFSESFKIVGYNLSKNPPETFLLQSDDSGQITNKRLLGKSMYLKDSESKGDNTVLLLNTAENKSIIQLVDKEGITVQSNTFDFIAEKLLLHPKGGYVLPGHDKNSKPIVVTLDAFIKPSKFIPLKGDIFFDAILIDEQFIYVSMNKKTRKCNIYRGNSDSIYQFTNKNALNCALTKQRNMIQLHTQVNSEEIQLTKFNILNRVVSNQSFKIKRSDFFQVFSSTINKFYYLTQFSSTNGKTETNFYTLKFDEFQKVKFRGTKNAIYSYPFEFEGTVFSTGYQVDINGANHNEIVVLP